MNHVIGLLTIGQSPRTDITSELRMSLYDNLKCVESGLLDGMSDYDREKFVASDKDKNILISRLRNGEEIVLSETRILPLLKLKVHELLSLEVEEVVLLCSGYFPEFDCNTTLPYKLLFNIADTELKGKKLGVILPSYSQKEETLQQYLKTSIFDVIVEAASPYSDDLVAIDLAAQKLKEWRADMIIMDCFGYDASAVARVEKNTGIRTTSARKALIGYLNKKYV